MQSLRDLPSQFHPIVLCLSFHDVLKGFPQKLRKYGFPIVSAGTTASTLFVDRFYSISSRFAYSCSPALGSHTYYLVESGAFLLAWGPTLTSLKVPMPYPMESKIGENMEMMKILSIIGFCMIYSQILSSSSLPSNLHLLPLIWV